MRSMRNQGHLDDADAALRRAMRTFQGLGYATLELAAVTQLGRVAAELGSDAEALALLRACNRHGCVLGRPARRDGGKGLPRGSPRSRRPLRPKHWRWSLRRGRGPDQRSRVRPPACCSIASRPALSPRRETTEGRSSGSIVPSRSPARLETYFELVVLLFLRGSLEDGHPSTGADRGAGQAPRPARHRRGSRLRRHPPKREVPGLRPMDVRDRQPWLNVRSPSP